MPQDRDKQFSAVTVGVERVLYEAATDAAFRQRLMADRSRALQEHGSALKPSEQAVLSNVSAKSLDAMIDAIRVPEHKRRRFMKAVAAVSVGAAGTVLVQGCPAADKGIRPQDDADVEADATVDASVMEDATASFGVRPTPPPPGDFDE